MKSSRVVFTMLFGVVISRKRYRLVDYLIVVAMVAGLALFMHADANSSAVFDLAGVLMLTVSLLCDGAISNVSETIMSKFGVGQDEVRVLNMKFWRYRSLYPYIKSNDFCSSSSVCTQLLWLPLRWQQP